MTKHILASVESRFLDRIARGEDDDIDCWTWEGALTSAGYGALGAGRRNQGIILAHRYSYEFHFQEPIPSGMDICHRCNNRKCVNPNHLYVGTRKQNMQQAKMDGRLKREFRTWSQERRDRHEMRKAANGVKP